MINYQAQREHYWEICSLELSLIHVIYSEYRYMLKQWAVYITSQLNSEVSLQKSKDYYVKQENSDNCGAVVYSK